MEAKELTVKIEVAPWYTEAMNEIAEVLANKNGLFEDTAYQLYENIAGILLNHAISVETPNYDYSKPHKHELTLPNHTMSIIPAQSNVTTITSSADINKVAKGLSKLINKEARLKGATMT